MPYEAHDRVPELVGLMEAEAVAQATALGLTVRIFRVGVRNMRHLDRRTDRVNLVEVDGRIIDATVY